MAGSDASDAPTPILQAGADVVLLGEGIAAAGGRYSSGWMLDPSGAEELVQGVSGVTVPCRSATAEPPRLRMVRRRAAGCHRPPGISSMSSVTVPSGTAPTDISASTWRPRAVAPSAATGARNPSGAITTCNVRAAEVAAEMASLKRDLGPDHIWFADDIFGFRVDWVTRVRRARYASGRIDSLHHPDARRPDQRAHGGRAAPGRMSRGLARRGKRQSARARRHEQRHEVAELVTRASGSGRHGIRVGFFIQLGYLGEELD